MLNSSACTLGILALLLTVATPGTDASDVQSLAVGSAGLCTCVILTGGSMKCWGNNVYGQLGQGSTIQWGSGPSLLPRDMPAINLGTGITATAVVVGQYHTCAIVNDGKVKCWGRNIAGQLGLGSNVSSVGSQSADMGDALQYVKYLGAPATALAAGLNFICALQSTGSVRCWGHNGGGQLGRGNIVAIGRLASDVATDVPLGTGRTAKSISAGNYHVCVVLDNDQLKCWGSNGSGQLGYDDVNGRGDQPDELGDNLPYVNLGAGRTAKQVSCGSEFTCALLDDSTVKCWGSNAGTLGRGNTFSYGINPGQMAALTPVDVGTGRTVKALSAGSYHVCVVLDNDDLKCWGQNSDGRLGIGNANAIGDNVGEMGDNLIAANLGTGSVAATIATYSLHTCAVLSNQDIKCWGNNVYGQLGLGSTQNMGDAPTEMGDNLPAVDLPLASRPPPPSPLLASPSPPSPSPSPPPPSPSPPPPSPSPPAPSPSPPAPSPSPPPPGNVPPVITSLSATPIPVRVGSRVTLTVNFSDPDVQNTHTVKVKWDAGNAAVVEQIYPVAPGARTLQVNYTYSVQGLYNVCVELSDGSVGGQHSACLTDAVPVYNPQASTAFSGFGGLAPAPDAFTFSPSIVGGVQFYLSAAYSKTGVTYPVGEIKMSFRTNTYWEFRAKVFDWLVISGPQIDLRGQGYFLGDSYFSRFIMTANDLAPNGTVPIVDTLRLQVIRPNGDVVFDNLVPGNPNSLLLTRGDIAIYRGA